MNIRSFRLSNIKTKLYCIFHNIDARKVLTRDNFPFKHVVFEGEYFHSEANFQVVGTGNVRIGNNVIVARDFMAICTLHQPIDGGLVPYDSANDVKADVVLKDNVWIGARVTIMAGVTIGEGSVIGAGAIVTKDVPACSIMGGIPARTIRMRDKLAYERSTAQGNLYLQDKYRRLGRV